MNVCVHSVSLDAYNSVLESDELQLVNPTEEIQGEVYNRCEEKVICSTVLRMKFGF